MSKRSVIQSPVVVAVIWGARAALAQDCLGEPTFYGTTTASTDDAPFTARLCDIDGDGDLDVITANDASDTVSVLLNDGLGSLLELRRWPVGETGTIHEPVDMDCCDFDGDGIMDLVTANHASDDVSILLGLGVVQGVPQFGPAVHHLVGEAPWAVRCAPVDGDGYADIITAGFTEDAVSILINDGAGGVAADDSYSVAVGNAPRVTTRCNSRPAAISIKRSRCSSAILTCSTWRRLVFTRSSSIPTGMAASSARSKPISSPSTRPLKAGRCWDAVDHDAHVRRGPAPE